jgi:hypothetical protein
VGMASIVSAEAPSARGIAGGLAPWILGRFVCDEDAERERERERKREGGCRGSVRPESQACLVFS